MITIERFKTKYLDCKVVISNRAYPNKNLALQVYAEDGEPLMTASVNPQVGLKPGLVAIKEWGENEGVRQALIDGGVIEPESVGSIPSGYVVIEIFKLTAKAREAFKV